MRNRTALVAAAVVLALLITGLAWAATDSTTARSETNVAIAAGQQQIIPVDSAGSVVLLRTDSQLQILSVIPNTGYTPEIEVAAGREVEADFRGEVRRVKFNAELEEGQVRVRIEIDNDDSGGTASTASTSSTGSTSSTSSTGSTSSTSSTGSTSSTSSTSTTGPTANVPNGNVNYSIGAAGTVTVNFNGGRMSIVSINASSGWTVDQIQNDSDEIEIELRNGESEIRFKLDIEGGRVRADLRTDNDRNNNDDDNSGSGGDDNDDNSGSGSGGDDNDDNSGSGSGGDDDDDNSGSGSGGDDDDDTSGSGS